MKLTEVMTRLSEYLVIKDPKFRSEEIIKPPYDQVKIVQVTPTHAELFGNLENMLEALVANPREVREKIIAIFVVNNPLLHCWLDEILGSSTHEELKRKGVTAEAIEKQLIAKGYLPPNYEKNQQCKLSYYISRRFLKFINRELSKRGAGLRQIFKMRDDYLENQLTIKMIGTLSAWVARIKQEKSLEVKQRLRAKALKELESHWKQYQPDKPMSRVWKIALRQEINLEVIDHSSVLTAFDDRAPIPSYRTS